MKQSITLVSLGGIKKLSDIPIFLFNMFNDKNILPVKQPFRALLSAFITIMRTKGTYSIYKCEKSPVFNISKKQASSLKDKLGCEISVFYSYSKPLLKKADNNLCVPLYGFYSHTTHGIVFEKCGKVFAPFCIFSEFFDLIENRIKDAISDTPEEYKNSIAVLLSAHSLPVKLAKKTKDPYKRDLEIFANYLKRRIDRPLFLSFQSKLGPIEWFSPSTEDMIKQLSFEYKALIVVPISFIIDNTETVYEIDYTYKNLAYAVGMEYFYRVECLNYRDDFIDFLAKYLK